jgi:hypothetical protein
MEQTRTPSLLARLFIALYLAFVASAVLYAVYTHPVQMICGALATGVLVISIWCFGLWNHNRQLLREPPSWWVEQRATDRRLAAIQDARKTHSMWLDMIWKRQSESL